MTTTEWTVPNSAAFPQHRVALDDDSRFPINLDIGGPAHFSPTEARGIAKALLAAADEAEGKVEPKPSKVWLLPPVSEEATRLELAQVEARAEVLRRFLAEGLPTACAGDPRCGLCVTCSRQSAEPASSRCSGATPAHLAATDRSVDSPPDTSDCCAMSEMRRRAAGPLIGPFSDSSMSAGRSVPVLTISVEVSGGRGADTHPCRCGEAS